MPMPSIGALARAKAESESSSRPPLTKIVTSRKPPASRMPRTLFDSAIRSPLSRRTARIVMPAALQARRQRHDFSRGGFGVVGVEQQHEIVRPRAGKSFERRHLVVERLDEGMRHGAVERDAEHFAGQHRGGAGETGEVARPRRHQSGLGAMGPAQPEIDQHFVRRGEPHARRLGGDQRLKMQNVDQPRFDELRLRQRRGDAQDRLVGEEHRAFGHGVHVAAETEVAQIIEQVLLEPAGALQPGDLVRREAKVLQKIERLLQPGRQQKSAPRRQGAGEKFEHRRIGIAMVQIGLGHVELVEVGEQRADRFIGAILSAPAIAGEGRHLLRTACGGGGEGCEVGAVEAALSLRMSETLSTRLASSWRMSCERNEAQRPAPPPPRFARFASSSGPPPPLRGGGWWRAISFSRRTRARVLPTKATNLLPPKK